jgi:hypothetical protein
VAQDPIKRLLADAADDQEKLSAWLADRLGELVVELEEAGFEVEDIPGLLGSYAVWMRRNIKLFQD